MNPSRFTRTALAKVESRALTEAEKSAGYIGALTGVIPLNSDSVMLRDRRLNNGQPFVERIAPKAFDGAKDVMGMAGHTDDTLGAFARQGVNLTLVESASELRWEALVPNTSAGRDLVEQARLGIVRGTSFEFELGAEDTWEKRTDGTAVRTVTKGTLTAVNPVVWPAYDDSELSVNLRGATGLNGAKGHNGVYLGRIYTAEQVKRGYYLYQSADYSYGDRTITPDTAYAMQAIGAEVSELTEALAYLRDQPTGGLADYANQQVTECSSAVKMLADFLAANGATINPEAAQRQADLLAEAETRAGKRISTDSPQGPRERLARIIHR